MLIKINAITFQLWKKKILYLINEFGNTLVFRREFRREYEKGVILMRKTFLFCFSKVFLRNLSFSYF